MVLSWGGSCARGTFGRLSGCPNCWGDAVHVSWVRAKGAARHLANVHTHTHTHTHTGKKYLSTNVNSGSSQIVQQ